MPAPEWIFAEHIPDGAPIADPQAPTLGEEVAGRYRLHSILGRGASSIVYAAHDLRTRATVAVKLLRGALADDAVARFQREARLLAKLRHTQIVHSLGSGVTHGRPYLVCELVEGPRTLLDLLEKAQASELLELVQQAAEALGYAHAKGVVHRDIKPENLLVSDSGGLKIVDFGLGWCGDLDTLTQSGALVGTPSYMAPEQFVGDRDRIGPATDVWALGVILYRCLAGVLPFTGSSLGELRDRVLNHPAPALPRSVLRGLTRVCDKALEKRAERRQPDAGSFARELRALTR